MAVEGEIFPTWPFMEQESWTSMPRIPDKLVHSIAFLYPTRSDAENNTKRGGTCFLVGKEIDGIRTPEGGATYLIYAVTNFHVAWTARSPVIRLNRRDGRTHILDFKTEDWIPHPNGDDLAVAFITDRIGGLDSVDQAMDHITFVQSTILLTEDMMQKCSLGYGDDVFMIGRFLNHQGSKDKIVPAVRLGCISAMPEPIWNEAINADQLSFAVEMRSRTGFSGSPVAAYRSNLTSIFHVSAEIREFLYVIGVNWGYILEKKDTRENTWLNGVVPAWKILELLEVPVLRDKQDKVTEELKEWFKSRKDSNVVLAVATDDGPPASELHPKGRERFNSLLGAAAQKRESKD